MVLNGLRKVDCWFTVHTAEGGAVNYGGSGCPEESHKFWEILSPSCKGWVSFFLHLLYIVMYRNEPTFSRAFWPLVSTFWGPSPNFVGNWPENPPHFDPWFKYFLLTLIVFLPVEWLDVARVNHVARGLFIICMQIGMQIQLSLPKH